MIYKTFDELITVVKDRNEKTGCAVVLPEDSYTLQAVIRAYREDIITPILIGNPVVIEKEMEKLRLSGLEELEIIDIDNPEEATQKAVDLVHEGRVSNIMKGLIKTATFMHVLLKKENGLRTGRAASMLSIREMPNYHKLIALTDTALCIEPDLETKRQIIENAVEAMISMGFDKPKVAALASAEAVNPKMSETLDAAELVRMNEEGIIRDCKIAGPLSFDLAVRNDAAAIKGVDDEVAGDADLLLFPDLRSANITAKAISFVSGIPVGSLVLGTKIPVIISSRSSPAETKYLCIALAAAAKLNK